MIFLKKLFYALSLLQPIRDIYYFSCKNLFEFHQSMDIHFVEFYYTRASFHNDFYYCLLKNVLCKANDLHTVSKQHILPLDDDAPLC